MRVLGLAFGATLLLMASGCFTHGSLGIGVSTGIGVIHRAPPAPYREYYGSPPHRGYFWVPGYWYWNGWDYSWRRGYWEAPRQGYWYEPHIWKKDRGNWYLYGGKWKRR